MTTTTLSTVAQQLIQAAIQAAEQQNLAVAASIVDIGGHLVAFTRMDGVGYMANDITRRKAITACNFKMPTHAFYELLQKVPELQFAIAKEPEVLAVAGGMPIIVKGTCIGGLGVGGGNFEQDQQIAEKAMQTLLG